ncbi:preprotein translocase subunit YajC [Maioricimonas rarisocia]|uniref:Sec translocon accessory complex subunit YajC n=1 Tax=Maioricimonas rarisocia TaxID=2528026 RepID=A0A517Z9F1_9PLAN|nr:preprotein translocase subunit YajC [Maioricimonas rarisocia]QDU39114.1 preprotein translocase subunit YajC [Maioricimonas rarisocia]
MDVANLIVLLAQNGGDAPAAQPEPVPFWVLLAPILIVAVLYQLMISGPQRREQARRDEMLKGLKKNDPIVTIGGILGTVVSVSEDGSEVTVRVDDNARLKMRRDAIREVIRKETAADGKNESKSS